MRRRGFQSRPCWICGKILKSRDDCDFFVRGNNLPLSSKMDDYNGYCKEHNIKEILLKTGSGYQIRKVKERKMTRFILNLFLIGLAIEILVWLPKILGNFYK